MDSMRMLMATILVAVSVSSTLAKEFVVGDDNGWEIGFDYAAWAEGKKFHVGDRLIFRYKVGTHNVIRVDETAYQQCVVPPSSEVLTTGKDIITLEKPGKKWFICGVSRHCELGKQKVAIDVDPKPSPASPNPDTAPPAFIPQAAANVVTASTCAALLAAALGLLVVVTKF